MKTDYGCPICHCMFIIKHMPKPLNLFVSCPVCHTDILIDRRKYIIDRRSSYESMDVKDGLKRRVYEDRRQRRG